jgi:hypothetical protein
MVMRGGAVADLRIAVALDARPGVEVVEDTDPEVGGFDSDILGFGNALVMVMCECIVGL